MALCNLLQIIVKEQGGFLRKPQIAELAKADRLRNLLVRCGNGRFVCPAQDVQHFINIIEDHCGDYVRDVSLPTSDDAYRGTWRVHMFEGECRPVPAR